MNLALLNNRCTALSAFVLSGAMLLCSTLFVVAQDKPQITTRNDLATALTDFLKQHRDLPVFPAVMETRTFTFDGTRATPSDATDDLYLFDPINASNPDGCDPAGQSFSVDIDFYTNGFVMRRVMSSPGTFAGEDSEEDLGHELAVDLNAWLNAVWGMELKGIAEFDALGWQCGTSDNRFYTEETTDPSTIDAIKELSGENDMLEKWYNINGSLYKGDQIFTFEKSGVSRSVRYMTDRGDPNVDPNVRDTIRYLANAYIKVALPNNGGTFELLIQMKTSTYLSDHCGISSGDPDDLLGPTHGQPNGSSTVVDAGDVRILRYHLTDPSILLRDLCNPFGWYSPNVQPSSDDFGENTDVPGYFNDADSASKRMFRYVREHRGEWRQNPLGDPGLERIKQLGYFKVNHRGDLLFYSYLSDCCEFKVVTIGSIMNDFSIPEEVCAAAYCRPTFVDDGAGGYTDWEGEFILDENYKMLFYQAPSTCIDCSIAPIVCLPFCDSAAVPVLAVTKIIAANARTFSDRTALVDEAEYWKGSLKDGPLPWFRTNDFERGLRGKWRPSREFVYRTNTQGGTGLFANSTEDERNYNDAGTFDLNLFNWNQVDKNGEHNWLNPTRVIRYSHNGEPVEEVDILGIPSTAHFGYEEQVPILIAKNASYNSVLFESFEDGKGNNTDAAHSGDNSLLLPKAEWPTAPKSSDNWNPVIAASFIADEYAYSDDDVGADDKDEGGLLVQYWAKPFFNPSTNEIASPVEFKLENNGNEEDFIPVSEIEFVAKTGQWGLFQFTIDGLTSVDESKRMNIRTISLYQDDPANSNYVPVRIDDFRMQPMKSEMVCYVYDPDNLRQIAQFDDQHFGVFFQYNGEGKLIRRLRETERGVRTVQESQYNTPLAQRAYGSSTVTTGTSLSGWDNSGAAFGINGSDGNTSTFDLLDVEIGLDKRDVQVFGVDINEFGARMDQWKELLALPSIERSDLPDGEKLRALEELDRLTEQLDSLNAIDKGKIADKNKQKDHEAALEATVQKRRELLFRLKLPESEARSVVDRARKLRKENQRRKD